MINVSYSNKIRSMQTFCLGFKIGRNKMHVEQSLLMSNHWFYLESISRNGNCLYFIQVVNNIYPHQRGLHFCFTLNLQENVFEGLVGNVSRMVIYPV